MNTLSDLERFDEWRRLHQAHGTLTTGGLDKDNLATVTCSCGDSKVIRFVVKEHALETETP